MLKVIIIQNNDVKDWRPVGMGGKNSQSGTFPHHKITTQVTKIVLIYKEIIKIMPIYTVGDFVCDYQRTFFIEM